MENTSILASIASPIAVLLVPICGIAAWQLAAAAVTGFIAKENVVGTLAVCFVGLENLIEGELKPGTKVVVVEDLISTGGSSLKAVEAIRNYGCEVVGMVASYTYGFDVAEKAFKDANVELVTLTNYEAVVAQALSTGYIKEEEVELLNQWRKAPSEWQG